MTRVPALALVLALTLACVHSQREPCFSRQHQNAAVNTRAAIAAVGAPVARSLATEQECVLACCSQPVQQGAKCNMVVFNGNKRGGEDNCFLYHCPNERDCPLMKAPPGVRTYDIFKGVIHPSTARPVATTTSTCRPLATTTIAATPAPAPTAAGDAALAPVLVTTTAPKRMDKMAKKQNKTKTNKKTKSHLANEEAGPRTADKLPMNTPPAVTVPPTTSPPPPSTSPPTSPPTTTTAAVTPPPMTMTPPTTNVTPPPIIMTPPTTIWSPLPTATTLPTTTTLLAPVTTQPPPSTTTPPPSTTTPPPSTTTPPPSTTTPPPSTTTPPTTTAMTPPLTVTPTTIPPPTTTSTPSSTLITPTSITSSSRRSQTPKVLVGPHSDTAQNTSVKTATGSLKSGAVAMMVVGAAVLMLALAAGGRKAMESFDRRHYTRLELNDLHYDL
ncbi:MANSC domain-containing protein 1 isoform X2 [Vanacampus margaritifer]